MNKHTPTPWNIGLDSNGTSIDGKIEGNWYPIADISCPMIAHLGSDRAFEIQEANAKFIVKAVNNYEYLLEIAKIALIAVKLRNVDDPRHKETIDFIKQALKNCEE